MTVTDSLDYSKVYSLIYLMFHLNKLRMNTFHIVPAFIPLRRVCLAAVEYMPIRPARSKEKAPTERCSIGASVVFVAGVGPEPTTSGL